MSVLEAVDKLTDVFERLEELGADTAETRAAEILHGLGFTKSMMEKKCRDFSGKPVNNFSESIFYMRGLLFFRWLEDANRSCSCFILETVPVAAGRTYESSGSGRLRMVGRGTEDVSGGARLTSWSIGMNPDLFIAGTSESWSSCRTRKIS